MKKGIFIVMVMLLLAACGTKDEVFPPEDIQIGVDRCVHCNMLVPDDFNATQLLLNDGRSLKFDDIGCMVEWANDNGMDDVNVRYVRDYVTEEWIVMENATFVYHKEYRTPMAYGVYSFSSLEDAESFVIEQGKGEILSYAALEGHIWERDMEMMKKMKEEMGHHHHGHESEDHEDNDHDHEEEKDHGHDHGKKDEKKTGH
ncbi:nitrous oxide reductase accessory protein NosL [Anaerobacillus isosaccharinicus]|uniref:Nitrous oxide reductase accessory protein NosL n=1 Tax=Anaerobacillus isosaccharinicus TaxID=1532552 RepID=A0A1S2M315_9BACI|nr:nitrous oxide reductase accessory protein NosL [Anaerobacillus isosaccharinicus]MBA5585081.1 nitrous oxide reductase accessory protein NosL [Anaerobacillus isosaccharinicus]QOY36574.1 nitrous oxide reductase accessory protein NosL [Anaerobacillus isosaccharinicus]